VLFVTAKYQVEDEERGLTLGALDYIHKPISPPVIRARVRNHIALKRQTDALKNLSYTDGLTGVANRRHFDNMLDSALRRATRTAQPLSLLMLDVDHFKAFNDHYGHGHGDVCLQQIAQTMQAAISRPDDLLARYGGEEFVVLLPETDLTGACIVAETLRHAVAAALIDHAASPVCAHVTISIGVACTAPERRPDAGELLQRADQALYHAKLAGRNRTHLQP
jgi:diguanylate cyclase (GGDEF)-like protein